MRTLTMCLVIVFISTTLGQVLSCDDSSNHLQYVTARSQESVVSMITRIILWTGLRNRWSLHHTDLSVLKSMNIILGPTQPHTQWAVGPLYLGVK